MIAPLILPKPPITDAINPLMVNGIVNSGDITPTDAAARHPANPPKTPAKTKVDILIV